MISERERGRDAHEPSKPPQIPKQERQKIQTCAPPLVAVVDENILITERARERVHGQWAMGKAHAFCCFFSAVSSRLYFLMHTQKANKFTELTIE